MEVSSKKLLKHTLPILALGLLVLVAFWTINDNSNAQFQKLKNSLTMRIRLNQTESAQSQTNTSLTNNLNAVGQTAQSYLSGEPVY